MAIGRRIFGPAFRFHDAGPLIDHELELIEPASRWIDALLLSQAHPANIADTMPMPRRAELVEFVNRNPRGRSLPTTPGYVPAYTFWMHLRPQSNPPVPIAGSISLRIGDDDNLRMYLGHIGYGVSPVARGRHLAERASRLLLPLARSHGLNEIWITTNPDNIPSRRTCERLGAEMVEIVDLPPEHPLFLRGDRQKCRYRLSTEKVS